MSENPYNLNGSEGSPTYPPPTHPHPTDNALDEDQKSLFYILENYADGRQKNRENYDLGGQDDYLDVLAKAVNRLQEWSNKRLLRLIPPNREYGPYDIPVVVEQIKTENRVKDELRTKLKGGQV